MLARQAPLHQRCCSTAVADGPFGASSSPCHEFSQNPPPLTRGEEARGRLPAKVAGQSRRIFKFPRTPFPVSCIFPKTPVFQSPTLACCTRAGGAEGRFSPQPSPSAAHHSPSPPRAPPGPQSPSAPRYPVSPQPRRLTRTAAENQWLTSQLLMVLCPRGRRCLPRPPEPARRFMEAAGGAAVPAAGAAPRGISPEKTLRKCWWFQRPPSRKAGLSQSANTEMSLLCWPGMGPR